MTLFSFGLSFIIIALALRLFNLEKRVHQLELDRVTERQREIHAP